MIGKKKTSLTVILIIAILVLALSGVYFYSSYYVHNSLFREDLKRFSQEPYDSVFLSMHSSSSYTPDIFTTYFALNTLISTYEIQSMDDLHHYLEKVFSSGNTINKVFLMLDPDMLWNSCGKKNTRWDAKLQKDFLSYVSNYPDTDFEILLPYPSLSYWLSMDQDTMDDILTVYHNFIEGICIYTNIHVYYMGFENWLLINPDNYISDFDANDAITVKIFLTYFYNDQHQITPSNDQALFDILRKQVIKERTSPTVYPDLSDCCLIFFGDSTMAYGEGTTTTPKYITGLSHAATYNYAIGGSAGSSISPDTDDFPIFMPRFLAENCTKESGTGRFSPEGVNVSDKKLYFLLTYGVNDYFRGAAIDNPDDPYDITTYIGGLRSGLKECMALFPDAEFIIMTPAFTSYFSNGTEPQSDVGGVLTDYVDAAISLAEELDIRYMDNYHDLGTNESNVWDYTADGCHPNEDGRVLMAKHIIDFIDSL